MSYYGSNGYVGVVHEPKKDEVTGKALQDLRRFIAVDLSLNIKKARQLMSVEKLKKLESSCADIITDISPKGFHYTNKWVVK